MSNVKLEASWKEALKEEFEKPYFQQLKAFLVGEKKAGVVIYPPGKLIFNAFDSTPFDKVKVVIIGQDPYHGPGQAHGLSFSVQPGVSAPPSLKNIFKEMQTDLGLPVPNHGHLQKWADQGVLMLNAILTVRASQAASHRKKGWESFTDAAIQALNEKRSGIVFLLWGRFAQQKGQIIDRNRHTVLVAPHPSPLARGGFFGCRHFSRTNSILQQQGMDPIDWSL